MLTGKCKKDFEKWLINKEGESDLYTAFLLDLDHGINGEIPFSMQYGVYVDFFLSKFQMLLTIDWFENGEFEDVIISERFTEHTDDGLPLHKTLYEARQKAIEKANEIYNETYKTDKG